MLFPRIGKKLIFYIGGIMLILVLSAGLFWHLKNSGKDDSGPIRPAAISLAPSLANLTIPIEFKTPENETIAMSWTDNNDNENLIIQSDQKHYFGAEQAQIYFSITNASAKEQNMDVVFWFDSAEKKVSEIYVLTGDQWETSEIKNCKLNENCLPSGDPPQGEKLEIGNYKRKSVSGYTCGNSFTSILKGGETKYFKALISYPPGTKESQFFIEAFGLPRRSSAESGTEAGALAKEGQITGYGHLDPWLSDGLVGYWTFDGNDTYWSSATAGITNDKSGNGNTGTMTNMNRDTSPAIGKVGQALSFDGVNDYVTVSDISSLDITSALTITAWIKTTTLNTGTARQRQVIAGKYNSTLNQRGYEFNFEDNTDNRCPNQLAFTVSSTVTPFTGGILCSDIELEAGQWYFVTARFWASNMEIYINGEDHTGAMALGSAPSSIASNSQPLKIGDGEEDDNFKGLIDEVRIYNRALSATEITRLYNYGAVKLDTSAKTANKEGLVGYWSFDGPDMAGDTAYDRSGSSPANNGILTPSGSSGPTRTLGKLGQALSFDGGDDYVSKGSNFSEINKTSSWSVAAWVKTDAMPADRANADTIWENPNSSSDRIGLQVFGGSLVTGIYNGSSYFTKKGASISINTWYHAVVVFNGTNISLWVNGIESASAPPDDPALTETAIFTVGARAEGDFLFNGLIDEVRVYNKALSAAEVQKLYNSGLPKVNVSPVNSLTSGLVGYWTFDGNDTYWSSAATGITNDKSGSNNTGTMTNMSRDSSPAIGKLGQALSFDGADDYINTVDSPFDFERTDSFSASAWIKIASTAVENSIVGKELNSAAYPGWAFYVRPSSVRVFLTNDWSIPDPNKVVIAKNSAVEVDDNTWHHVAFTYSGTSLASGVNIYVDGNLSNGTVTYDNLGSNSILNNTAANIGSSGGGAFNFFNGLIDEVRIYNRALSATEIQRLYNMGR